MNNTSFKASKNEGLRHNMDIRPDPKRFTGAKQAADEWSRKHPNPFAFVRRARQSNAPKDSV